MTTSWCTDIGGNDTESIVRTIIFKVNLSAPLFAEQWPSEEEMVDALKSEVHNLYNVVNQKLQERPELSGTKVCFK